MTGCQRIKSRWTRLFHFLFARTLFAFMLGLVSATSFGHGTDNHEDYDAFIASMVRSEEQSGKAILASYVNQVFSKPPVHTLLSEVIDATLGKPVNAAVDGIPALHGQWGELTTWPFVFAAAANLPDGRILAWGGNNPTSFKGGTFTYAGIWDPVTGQIVNANHPSHSLFCGIPAMLEDGRVFVSGGDQGNASSVRGASTFDYQTQSWTRIQDLAVGRWYNGSVALPNGSVFSALGEPGSPYPELWTQGAGWTYLNGINLQTPILDFPTVTEPKNWLPHLHLAPNGKIFHSGHTPQMHYIDPTGNGSITAVGLTNDWNVANTPSILYDEGKILQSGGALYGTGNPPSGKSQIFDLTAGVPSRTVVPAMQYPRIFHNEVVLPNGEVMAIGGNVGKKFSDLGSQMTPEMWNPATQAWHPMADQAVPRNYHSVALLMADGRVWSGGGGLCNCLADHPNSQVFSPPYLFNADGSLAARPEIFDAPRLASYGVTLNITASPGVDRFTLVRMSATTHALNSDMRFLNVPFVNKGIGQYALTLHANRDVMAPGYWMLFALSEQGVPSIAKAIKISTSDSPVITNPGDQNTVQNKNVNLLLQAGDPNGDPLTFNAVGLPQGLTIDPTNGVISGTPTIVGSTRVVLSVTDGINTVSTRFVWTVYFDQTPVASSIFGDAGGTPFADAIESNETLVGLNLRQSTSIDGIQGILNTRVLPFHGGDGGTLTPVTWPINEYLVRIYGFYGGAIGQINFVTNTGRVLGPYGSVQAATNLSSFDISAPPGREIVGFTGRSDLYLNALGILHRAHIEPNQPPLVNPVANQINTVGDAINLAIQATDPEGETLTYSAIGLPPGLGIDPTTGFITGSPAAAGNYEVTVQAQDARSALSGTNFQWMVSIPSLTINPPKTVPKPVNTLVNFTASVNNAINPHYKWSFGDGTPETAYSSMPNANHRFAKPGLYVVRVTATDDRGVDSTQTLIQAVHLPHTANRPVQSSNMAFSSINGVNRLWVVNQDNDTVTVFNALNETKIREIAVGKAPRSIAVAPNGRVWVTNKVDASLSIIDPATFKVRKTISFRRGSQPHGLVFSPDGSAAYVVLEGFGKLLKLNPATGAIIAGNIIGRNIRHVAIQSDSAKIFIPRFITRPLPGESTARVQTSDSQGQRGGEVLVIDTATMTLAKTIVLQQSEKEDTENRGAGVPNYLAAPSLSPDGKTAWVPSKQDNVKRGVLRNRKNLNFQNTVRAIASKFDNSTLNEIYDARIDFDNSGIAGSAIYDLSGNYLFVALETSREISVVDAYGGRELRRIPVGLAPDGLVLSPNGKKLYVNNFMDRSVSIIDLTDLLGRGEWLAPATKTVASVGTEKLPPQVLKGKQLFYDAKDLRLASDAYLSCASCHNDGGHDGRVWDLTGFGEGLRNTIDLRGRGGVGHGLLHWSANFDEIQDFEGQIRNLAGGTGLMTDQNFTITQDNLGAPKKGLSEDLDALAAYVESLSTFQNSPYRNVDGSLTDNAALGKSLFISAGCSQCHGGASFTDSASGMLHDIGTLKPSSGKRLNGTLAGIDTPTLRDVWNTAPFLHNGSAPTLSHAIRAHNTVSLNETEVTQLVSYLQQIGASESAIPNQPTALEIKSPVDGATFTEGTTATLTVDAQDNDSKITKVEIYSGIDLIATDTTTPYEFSQTDVLQGTYVLTAKAYDNYGAVATSPSITVTVKPAAQ